MATMIDLLKSSTVINRTIDPDGDHQEPDSGSAANMARALPMADEAHRTQVASTGAVGDDQSNMEGAADMGGEEYNPDDEPNENNRRAAQRMQRDKEELRRQFAADNGVLTSMRAGSPLSPGDLSNGGIGGDFGATGQAERSVGEDAAQHAAAWGVAEAAAKAKAEAADKVAEQKAAKAKPASKASAASSELLGDDSKPAGWGSKAPAPTPTTAAPAAAAAAGTEGAAPDNVADKG